MLHNKQDFEICEKKELHFIYFKNQSILFFNFRYLERVKNIQK